jgi:mRNA-degrading endonuclease RelE of RelBE toxin-antitoxin system
MDYGYDICWDETALRSLRKTFNYLKKNVSATFAFQFKASVFEAVETLNENPERYSYDRILLEDPPRYRSIRLGSYRVVYEFKNNAIFVLLIYHSRQNPKKIRKMMP